MERNGRQDGVWMLRLPALVEETVLARVELELRQAHLLHKARDDLPTHALAHRDAAELHMAGELVDEEHGRCNGDEEERQQRQEEELHAYSIQGTGREFTKKSRRRHVGGAASI